MTVKLHSELKSVTVLTNINIPILQDNLDAVDYFVGYDKKWLDRHWKVMNSFFVCILAACREEHLYSECVP